MQLGPQGFNAAQFEPQMGMEKWPDGWHDLVIRSTEGKPVASGNGGKLTLVCLGISGQMNGRTAQINLNLWNTNPQAVEIANRELSALIYVTVGANQGKLAINDTNELCNIPFKALFMTDPKNPQYNNVVAYADMRGNDPKGQPVPTLTGAANAGPGGGGWQAPQGGAPAPGPGQAGPAPAWNAGAAPAPVAQPAWAQNGPAAQPQQQQQPPQQFQQPQPGPGAQPSWAGPGTGGAPQQFQQPPQGAPAGAPGAPAWAR